MKEKKLEDLLEAIRKQLSSIDRKMDMLLTSLSLRVSSPVEIERRFVPETLGSLPRHLRRTAKVIAIMGEATADQVAAKTGRTRAAESDYLNQLVTQGFLKRERRGRRVYFLVFSVFTLCPYCGTRVPMNSAFCSGCGASLSKSQAT